MFLGTRRQKKTGQTTNDLEEECRERVEGDRMAVIRGTATVPARNRDGWRAVLIGLSCPAGHDEYELTSINGDLAVVIIVVVIIIIIITIFITATFAIAITIIISTFIVFTTTTTTTTTNRTQNHFPRQFAPQSITIGYFELLQTGSLDNAFRKFSLAWPSWVMSHYTMLYEYGKRTCDFFRAFSFIFWLSFLYFGGRF